ncbi:TonB-dependent receptor [uncultured Desulfuromusa sp.]|uniref:TonB-dependent receptor plug domain-containing protein n=1 Tax=uncultured Desulfuromusa sp. TaxID=219183 RepID=UPI002AA930EB|nr:TonB-dependent receptor [uncultured Desulfuromusa sp.]
MGRILPIQAILMMGFWVAAATVGAIEVPAVGADQMVVTATMTPKELTDVPGAFEVITAEEIEMTGAETLDGVLEGALGVVLESVPGRGRIPQIRGLSNKRVLILIDGMRFSSGFRDTTVDVSEISTEFVERIEIVRGPSSALYGSEAIGGVINIITKSPPSDPSGSLAVRYGTNTYGEAENTVVKGAVGSTFGSLGIIAYGYANGSDEFDRQYDDYFSDIDDEARYSGGIKLHLDLADEHRISMGGYYNETSREGLRPKNSTITDRDADSDRTNAFIQYAGHIAGASVMLRSYYSQFQLDRNYTDIGGMNPNNRYAYEEFDINNELYQVEGQVSRVFAVNHLLSLGLEYREEMRSGVENRGETEVDETIDNSAVFIQDDFQLLTGLQVTAGLRLDDHSDFGSEVSPRISLIYAIRDNLRFKASYGEGFRAPSLYELYVETINMQGDVMPNPDLNPERSKSYEAGIEGEFGRFTGKIMIFKNAMEEMITKVRTGSRTSGSKTIPIYEMGNVEDAYTQGGELEARLQLSDVLSLTGNMIFIESENDETGDDLLDVPEIKSYLRLAYLNGSAGFKGNLRMNYIGRQFIAADNRVGGYTEWDIYAAKSIHKNFEIFAGIDNIFNKTVSSTASRGGFYYGGVKVIF